MFIYLGESSVGGKSTSINQLGKPFIPYQYATNRMLGKTNILENICLSVAIKHIIEMIKLHGIGIGRMKSFACPYILMDF